MSEPEYLKATVTGPHLWPLHRWRVSVTSDEHMAERRVYCSTRARAERKAQQMLEQEHGPDEPVAIFVVPIRPKR